jgi:hypothetical protein
MRIILKASPPNVFIGGPVPDPPGFPLKACGNDGLRIGNYLDAVSCGESTDRELEIVAIGPRHDIYERVAAEFSIALRNKQNEES